MTRVFENRKFDGYSDWNSGKTFAELEFRKCSFQSCNISTTRDVRRRSVIRNVKIIDCEQSNCSLGPAIVEDTLIHNIKNTTLLQTWGAVFKHVTLSGRIGQMMISPVVAPGVAKPEQQRKFEIANETYYAAVDWALDIREANFVSADIRNLPVRLIRRDPETQFILTREKALEGAWRNVDLSGTYWKIAIELLLEFGYPDDLLIACRANRKFRIQLDTLLRLRDAGVVE